MNYQTVIDILDRRTTIPDEKYSYEDINEAIDIAIELINLQIKKSPIYKSDIEIVCPTCHSSLTKELEKFTG